VLRRKGHVGEHAQVSASASALSEDDIGSPHMLLWRATVCDGRLKLTAGVTVTTIHAPATGE
jgi:hypothetical protein